MTLPILGFGVTEENVARKIINECYAAIKTGGKDALAHIKNNYDKLEKEYHEMSRDEAPSRYSYFWYALNEIYPGKSLVEFSIHHINRQHPLSPDGWGLLITKWILSIDGDTKSIYKEID